MNFIIVANNDLAPLGRKLAQALSIQKAHSGTFWTVKHYKDNEAQLEGKQPVIFLGDNEVAKSYVDILPERFSGFGVKCAFEGAKAVLIADEPNHVSQKSIDSLKRAVKDNQEELHRRAASVAKVSATGTLGAGAVSASAFASVVGMTLLMPVFMGIVTAKVINWFMSDRWMKQEYMKLQYEYALSRFLKDEFETYIGGVEGW